MTTKPTKEAVRAYLQSRQESKTPPPTSEEIRRQLGWSMMTKYARQ
jgi:hypothetical protein